MIKECVDQGRYVPILFGFTEGDMKGELIDPQSPLRFGTYKKRVGFIVRRSLSHKSQKTLS